MPRDYEDEDDALLYNNSNNNYNYNHQTSSTITSTTSSIGSVEPLEKPKEKTPSKFHIPSLIGIGLIGFLGPLEYSVVMPSLWYYLDSLGNSDQLFYGFVLASFSVAHMLGSPVVGWISDFQRMKYILVGGLLISAFGQIVYALAWADYALLIARVITGFGAANYTMVHVYIAKVTSKEERTGMVAKIGITTEAGMLLGPPLAIAFENVKFNIGPFEVNSYTAPGYLMFICCLLLLVYIAIFFKDPPKTTDSNSNPELQKDYGSLEGSQSTLINGKEDSSSSKLSFNSKSKSKLKSKSTSTSNSSIFKTLSRIITRATITVFIAQFILFFNQTSMEAILAPLTEEFYNFTPFENSLVFVGITLVFMIMYALITQFSKYVQDRTLIAIGLLFEFIALTLASLIFIFIESPPLWLFIFSVCFFVIGLPFFFCCTGSLLTKLVDDSDVGFASGLLSSVTNLGNIFGPIWAGTFEIEYWLPFVGELGIVVILIFVFSISFSKLYIPKDATPKVPEEEEKLIN